MDLRSLGNTDLIWMEKEALPYVPYFIERAMMPASVPCIVDYDDAIFHNYDLSKKWLIRRLLSKKIDQVMGKAAVVVCGNSYLAERALGAGAKKVEIVPTVVDLKRYSANHLKPKGDEIIIGWIGSPSTQHYLLQYRDALSAVCAQAKARLMLIGAHPDFAKELGSIPVTIVPWSEETEVQAISGFDIGIMPLPDEPWERGKCGYKLIQYMACGKAVVASPVGVNTEIVERSQSGFLARNIEEWRAALYTLVSDNELRIEMGMRGHDSVECHYSLDVQSKKIVEILRQFADR
ncbi:glycosyltransferase family 4 protein [Alloalcanivorax sp. C16-1]|uniref:glycosyltransferase family 4 protein n=1 Tax=Alloalcanivorax sp. C16-1 TaxID=3390051 RepID=UPI003970BB66